MSLWNATLAEQTGITTTLLDPDGLRPKLLCTPLLAAMVPGLDHVHAQLVVATPARTADVVEREVVALTEEGNALDAEHDRCVRGIFRLFEGFAEVAPSAEAADGYRALSKRVLPEGLATLKLSWMGEAGNAGRLRTELDGDADLRDALDAIALPGKQTMLTLVRSFVAMGVRLGAVEARRASLRQSLAAAAAADAAKEPTSVGAARKEWVDTVEALRSVLRMPQSPVAPDVRDTILSLIDEVERKADARSRARAAARKPEAPADPVVARPSKPPPANGAAKSVPPPAARPS